MCKPTRIFNMHRIGIDFGNTIGEVDVDPDTKGFSVIRMFVDKYGSSNMFIVSKAGDEMKNRIEEWLVKNNFFATTNFLKENVIFVKEYFDKRDVVIKNKIDVFIDDHYKVVSSLCDVPTIKHIVWFNKKGDIKLIPKEYRSKVVISSLWGKVWAHSWNSSRATS
ncbi:hypothetical protein YASMINEVIRUS_76 [Yasminevirus sp. GU-2018]|uniref:Uncharacterized protein n=1 Tax=Yasminevirus sp. GU-2018 TaxID=2420051 RepID=A0A5K0U8G0_9VIRU|nr:hypothetical protein YASMINEVIRUS_76 [Yasminevirus sp. GU-2018]